MATIKSYTNLQQSKKLAEILPLETADMHYVLIDTDKNKYSAEFGKYIGILPHYPCWSLAALLNYLKNKNKFPEIKELSDGRFKLTTYIWDGKDCIQVSIGDSIVDACYEMIIKLSELKML